MRKHLEIEIKVGLFVALGIGLIMLAILILGSTENLLVRQNKYHAHFETVEGLIPGAKVVLGGIHAGNVEKIEMDAEKRSVVVRFAVNTKYDDWVRGDSMVEIATQGVLGDKYISVTQGSAEQPKLPTDSEIPPRPSQGLTQFLSKSDQLMANLNSITTNLDKMLKKFETGNRSDDFFKSMAVTSKNLAETTEKMNQALSDGQLKGALKNLNGVLSKINNGTGTLGALVNDPGLYDDAKALMGGANRNRVIRNLVRQTVRKSDEAEAAAAEGEQKPADSQK